jgi:hypothetical protein
MYLALMFVDLNLSRHWDPKILAIVEPLILNLATCLQIDMPNHRNTPDLP